MKYVPYAKLSGIANVIVDGAAQADTVLTLSHWPGSCSPAQFRADTSTEIVLNYLAAPGAAKEHAPQARAVSNNHFDEDGLCAVWAMLNPKQALAQRDLLVDVATAGDFSTYRRPLAAKIVFALRSYADPKTSPLADKLQDDDESSCYQALLPLLESFLDETDRLGPFWDAEWAAMRRSKTAMVTGQVELQEIPAVDLAVAQAAEPLHPMVLYNNTQRLRVLTVLPGGVFRLDYRYESWVQFVSRPVRPRVDLGSLLPRLQDLERAPVRWVFDGIAAARPVLQPVGQDGQPGPSSLKLETLLIELVAFFKREQDTPALQWNPYAAQGQSLPSAHEQSTRDGCEES